MPEYFVQAAALSQTWPVTASDSHSILSPDFLPATLLLRCPTSFIRLGGDEERLSAFPVPEETNTVSVLVSGGRALSKSQSTQAVAKAHRAPALIKIVKGPQRLKWLRKHQRMSAIQRHIVHLLLWCGCTSERGYAFTPIFLGKDENVWC